MWTWMTMRKNQTSLQGNQCTSSTANTEKQFSTEPQAQKDRTYLKT